MVDGSPWRTDAAGDCPERGWWSDPPLAAVFLALTRRFSGKTKSVVRLAVTCTCNVWRSARQAVSPN
jgi:hypothetical protein